MTVFEEPKTFLGMKITKEDNKLELTQENHIEKIDEQPTYYNYPIKIGNIFIIVLSLETRRQPHLIKFLYNLVHNKILSTLLVQLQFFVPLFSTRKSPSFYTLFARLNPHYDIYFTALSHILPSATVSK
ncbi:hypothetical protein AMK59_4689 [Oryctes borbonicus]|uniref:Uncharacterized protein n=1 Tax=Oryctes borbonicus TaxID=1629725 RepID=A0A0T6B786_9SCAR|nr:hypothetical protein AMK59_4689 [Oryctes borbonicus]